jgi:hypothetical protein
MTTKGDRAYLNRRGGFTPRTEKTTIKRAPGFDGRGDYIGMGGMTDSRPEPLKAEPCIPGRRSIPAMSAPLMAHSKEWDELGRAEDAVHLEGTSPEWAGRKFAHLHMKVPHIPPRPRWLRVPKDRRSAAWTAWLDQWRTISRARECLEVNSECMSCAAHLRRVRGTRPPIVAERRPRIARMRAIDERFEGGA